jgi:hypothetical protein
MKKTIATARVAADSGSPMIWLRLAHDADGSFRWHDCRGAETEVGGSSISEAIQLFFEAWKGGNLPIELPENARSVASVGVPLTRERLLALPDDVRLLSNRCAYPPNPDLEGKIAHGTSREALWRAIVDGGLEGRTFEVVPDDRSLQYVKEEFRRAFNQCRPAKA